MTALEIQQRVLKRLDESGTSPVYYSGAEVLAAIDEGQRLFALLTLCLETSAQLIGVSALTYRMLTISPFSGDWLLPLRIRVAGGAKLDYARLADFDAINPAWRNETGTPVRYAALGFDFVALNPKPTSVTLDVTYARFPARITSTAQTPEVPEEHHPALIDYAIPCLRAKEGGQEFINSLKYFDRFVGQADRFASYMRTRNKALNYDRGPFEMKAFDRSRLIGAMKGKGA